MSATIHTSLYRDYFASRDDGTYGDMECLSVGVRRFPVTIQYAEDLEKFGETVNGNGSNSKGGSTREKAFGSQVGAKSHFLVSIQLFYALFLFFPPLRDRYNQRRMIWSNSQNHMFQKSPPNSAWPSTKRP